MKKTPKTETLYKGKTTISGDGPCGQALIIFNCTEAMEQSLY
jgi:hypothetical protein